MGNPQYPTWYLELKQNHGQYIDAVDDLGKTLRRQGPLDDKTAHLIQLGASVTNGSEGAVHSHVKRALETGASQEEICHTIILLTCTIGFPKVAAGLRWAQDVFDK